MILAHYTTGLTYGEVLQPLKRTSKDKFSGKIKQVKTCSGPSRLSLLTLRRRHVLFPQKIGARSWMSGSCPALTSWKQASSHEVIHKSNDPRRLRQTAPATTQKCFEPNKRDKRIWRNKASRMTLTSIFGWGAEQCARKQSKQYLLKPDVCVCVRDTNRERTAVQRFVVRLWWIKRLYNG